MLPYSFIGCGTYTNASPIVSVNVALTDQPDWFFVKDITNWGAQSTAANPVYAEWFSSMASGSYLGLGQPSSTTTGVTPYTTQGTTGGFTFINQSKPPVFTKVAVTSVVPSTMVVTATNTSLSVGSFVRLINIAGGQQISGSTVYQVTALTSTTSFTLGYMLPAINAGLTVAAIGSTTGYFQQVYPSNFYPTTLPVMYITQATQAKVYFARQNPYTVGELVDFQIPSTYGMVQLSNLTGLPGGAARVLVVTNTATESSITINVNTTGYTAFVFPTTTAYASGASPAVCFPAGSGIVPLNGSATIPQSPPGTNLLDAFDNHNQYIMNIGTNACGIASATMQWFAFKADFNNAITNA